MNNDINLPNDYFDSDFDGITIDANTKSELDYELNSLLQNINGMNAILGTWPNSSDTASSNKILDEIISEIENNIQNIKLATISKILDITEFKRIFNKLPEPVLSGIVQRYYD